MRKLIYLLFLLFCFNGYVARSQTIVVTTPQCKNVVLEEYTGIHCGYCPDGHKRADSMSRTFPGRVVLINIHQGSFSTPSGTEPDFRTVFGDPLATLAAVNGYPSGTINRHIFPGLSENGGSCMGRNKWFVAAAKIFPDQSPANVGFTSTYDSASRNLQIKVEVFYTKNSPASTNYLNIAFLENHVIGYQSDYSSSAHPDYDHKHILRSLITGQWGDTINSTSKGTLITRTYNYTVPTAYNIKNCDIAVFLAENHQEVYTGFTDKAISANIDGSTITYIGDLDFRSKEAAKGTPSTISNFNLKASSSFSNSQDFKLYLEKSAPNGWNASFEVDGTTYSDSAILTLAPATLKDIIIHVTPSANPGIGTFDIKMKSVSAPAAPLKDRTVYVISGVTDLIVNNDAPWGDSRSNNSANTFQPEFVNGLTTAGCSSIGATGQEILLKLSKTASLSGVKNLYFNVGWSFPSLTDSNVIELTKFLDNGGNMMISGQDIGWETWNTTTPYGTTATKNFFTNYLNASWNADGGSTNSTLRAVTTDAIYGNVPVSGIINRYGANPDDGTLYMYPDELTETSTGNAIFYYNNSQAAVAGVRSKNAAYKTVYLAVSLEMIADQAVRNQIMKLTYDWFNGTISSVKYDEGMASIGQNYPNPANDFTVIPVNNPGKEMTILLSDVNGKTINSFTVSPTATNYRLNCSALKSGIYFYRLTDGKTIGNVYKLQVIK